jgi:3-deoxy-D-manno-octulosonic-acid transferase
LLLWLGFPLFALYVAWRSLRRPDWRPHLAERFGQLSYRQTIPGGIWLHAVSVGEVIAAAGLVGELRGRFPGRPVYVSTSTVAGRKMAAQRLTGLADHVFYAPFDYPWFVRRVLRALRPASVVVLETEIWPSLWHEAKRFGCTLYLVNGRIADRTITQYRKLRWFFQPLLRLPDGVLAQSAQDQQRLIELGAAHAINHGNLKYDFTSPAPPAPEIVDWVAGAPLLIAASTMPPDEEQQVIDAYRQLPPGTRMILAPRRPERFALTADLLEAAQIPFIRRSQFRPGPERVLLLDTIGELAGLFALDAVVFVGGSLVNWGGHNILEPAFFGRPILTGPHMQNFAEMDREFREAGAVRIVRDAAELAQAVKEILERGSELGSELGSRAAALAKSKRGATRRAVEQITLGAPLTHRPLAGIWQMLSWVWRAGVALDRRFTTPVRLSKPVISVGGLAMGGVGKTPLVLWLARELRQRGHRVGILTRGYGRQDRSPAAFAPGDPAPARVTGDEAQLFLKSGLAHVGVGPNRAVTARLIEREVDVFLLDDGFQHWALERDFDIVLLDPLDPFAGGGVFPAGLLREPMASLQRAGAVVTVRKAAVNPPPPGRYTAFCGIGNPGSFFATLRECGVEVARTQVFPDHHAYRLEELGALRGPLITTEKDAANLPPGAPEVYVLKIDICLDSVSVGGQPASPDDLLAAISKSINSRLTSRP